MNRKRIALLIALAALAAALVLLVSGVTRRDGEEPVFSGERDIVRADFDYDEGTRTLRGTQTMTLTNRTGEALETLVLRAYMNGWEGAQVYVSGATVDGQAVSLSEDEDDPTVLRCRYRWEAGETVTLCFTLRIRHAGGLVQLPALAMWGDGAWREDAYDALADPSYAEAFDYTVSVGGRVVAGMSAARDASFALGGCERTRTVGGVQVTARAEDAASARLLLAQAKAALGDLEAIVLPYPYDTLTLVASDDVREDGLALSGLLALPVDGDRETMRRRITRLLARETFGILVESDPWNAPWLSETLASAAELLAYRARKGTAAYEERLYGEIELSTRLTRPHGVTVGAGTDRFGTDAEMTQVLRDEGAAMLLGIEQAVGEEAFMDALRRYAGENAGGTATQERFAEALREASGSSWAGYLADGLSS